MEIAQPVADLMGKKLGRSGQCAAKPIPAALSLAASGNTMRNACLGNAPNVCARHVRPALARRARRRAKAEGSGVAGSAASAVVVLRLGTRSVNLLHCNPARPRRPDWPSAPCRLTSC